MCDDAPTYNNKPVTLWQPVHELPVVGFVILRGNYIWRNKLFTSFDHALISLRFAYPKDKFMVQGNFVHRYRNGNYQIVEVNLENGG